MAAWVCTWNIHFLERPRLRYLKEQKKKEHLYHIKKINKKKNVKKMPLRGNKHRIFVLPSFLLLKLLLLSGVCSKSDLVGGGGIWLLGRGIITHFEPPPPGIFFAPTPQKIIIYIHIYMFSLWEPDFYNSVLQK